MRIQFAERSVISTQPPNIRNHPMRSNLRVLVSFLLVGLGVCVAQVQASMLEPIQPAEAMHFDAQSQSAWPAMAFTPEGRRFDAYLAEHDGNFALLGRLDYLRPWHLIAPWPELVTIANHPDLDAPSLAMDATGNVLAAWTINSASGSQGVFARGIDDFGQPRGEAFRVDGFASDWSGNTAVATGLYGLRYLVAWKSHHGTSTAVRAQLYDQDLQPIGGELVIDPAGSDAYMPIAAAWAPVGWSGPGYVAWTGLPPSGQGFPGSLWIQSVGDYGQLGPATALVEQQHLTTEAIFHDAPALAVDVAGNLVLAWRQGSSADQGWIRTSRIMAQRFDASLQPLTPAFQVSETADFAGAHQPPSLSVTASGEIVIAWAQSEQAHGAPAVYARQFDASGTALGAPFAVHGNNDGSHYTPRVVTDADGDTAFAWTQLAADGGRVDAMLRRYSGGAAIDLALEAIEATLYSHPGGALQLQLQGMSLATPDAGGFQGEGFATGLGVAVDLPEGSQLLQAFGAGWTCANEEALSCASSVALEGGGVTGPLELHVLAPEVPGTYLLRAAIAADQRDPVLGNNTLELTLTVAVPQPDEFSFASRSGVARDSLQVSETAMLSGFGQSLPIAVAQGEYSINGAAFTTSLGSVLAGDTVRVRHVAASNFETTITTSLYVGEFEAQFATTTEAADTIPNSYDFLDVANAPRKRDVFSNVVTVAGINAEAVISISGGGASYSKNGGAYTATSGTVRNGDTVRLRMRSANPPNSTTSTAVDIGGVVDVWLVTTRR